MYILYTYVYFIYICIFYIHNHICACMQGREYQTQCKLNVSYMRRKGVDDMNVHG